MLSFREDILYYWKTVRSFGITPDMEEYEVRKMSIFNQLNMLGILTGLVFPFIGVFLNDHLPPLAWFAACSPVAISILVLWLNYEHYLPQARIVYFAFYPLATCLVYLGKVEVGIELFFVLYGIMSVFFFQKISSILFSFSWSITCYFLASIVSREYYFHLSSANYAFYVFNHLVSAGLIFYGLFLIKKENTGYQFSLIYKSREVHRRNIEIEKQKEVIAEKVGLLEEQTRKLSELNQLKNKLFSVIAHDLKTPMYAMRNLFQNMQQHKISAKEIREMLPAIASEMNYTTSLMENLLQWAKQQMKADQVEPEEADITGIINKVIQLLQLQAKSKNIVLESQANESSYCYADPEMISLVLRNLVTNAIKFTPEEGEILVGINELDDYVEVFVQDSGIGISPENQQRLFNEDYFTTKGTNNESGTGLGLRLCKDFLEKNGGTISVKSKPGKGCIFSFTLPRCLAQQQVAG